jgi:uncharacterized protein (DUF2336 family)
MCPPEILIDAPFPAGPDPRAMSTEMLYRRATAGRVAAVMRTPVPSSAPESPPGTIDERLRHDLGEKFATFAPTLGETDQARLIEHVVVMLGSVIREAGRQLRSAIPELIEDWPEADCRPLLEALELVELPIGEPLIRLLPLLSGDDLMALISAPPASGLARLVAARPRLSDGGADALARAARPPAIEGLLTSPETAIREGTLDALIARETGQPEWSEPLVQAPSLPPQASRALAGLVAWQMLAALSGWPKIRQSVRDELRTRLHRRLSGQVAQPFTEPSSQEAVDAAHRLKRSGALTETILLATARRGESRLLGAMLAVAAGVPISAVNRAVSLRSTKGLVSLIWRAGFSMILSGPVQSLLARVPSDEMLLAGAGGRWPLSVEEMHWHLEFLSRVGR